MPEIEKDLQAYWDGLAEKAWSGQIMRDNWSKRRLIVKRLLEYDLTHSKILEIGCGLGITAAVISLVHGYKLKYVGTDVSLKFIEAIKTLSRLNAVHAKCNNLPFDNGSFDVIWCLDSLEHIKPDERQDSYFEIGRVLGKHGLIMINLPLSETQHDLDYDFEFTDHDICNLMSATGTHIVKIEEYGGPKEHNSSLRYKFVVLER